LVGWPEYDQFGCRNLGLLDFGEDDRILKSDSSDIDRMLANFGTGKISVMVNYLNVKVDCVV
jgi:hypothetical protein